MRAAIRRHQKGVVLLIVLWTVAILMIMAGATGQTSRLDTKLSIFTAQEIRCKWAARAGVEKAIALLNEDDPTTDSLNEDWATSAQDLVDVQLEGCTYTVRIVDESGKLNVNTATREQLLGLFDWGMDPAIADAIIDWRDPDDEPGEEGVEVGYYENLPYRYNIRNGPFKTMRELLKVRGVTGQLLYGEDTNLNGKLDKSEQDGDLTLPLDNGDDVLDEGWIAFLTCYSPQNPPQDPAAQTKVDINQATAEQLQQLGLTAEQAQAVIDNRPSGGYTSLASLFSSTTTTADANATGVTAAEQQTSQQTTTPPLDIAAFRTIVDQITIQTQQGQPKININTAPLPVLVAILGGDDLAYEIAYRIVEYRDSALYGFESIGELLDVPSMTSEVFASVVDLVDVRSNLFTIYSFAKTGQAGAGGASWFVEAVVERGQSPARILYWYEGATP
ncbi:MAG: type II secretion system protein GspK [Sedimentisphaerales bacterium]|nr:type II secretion system protein GspK [Sedimentisphaerales bacterium]